MGGRQQHTLNTQTTTAKQQDIELQSSPRRLCFLPINNNYYINTYIMASAVIEPEGRVNSVHIEGLVSAVRALVDGGGGSNVCKWRSF
jgi:hypothetical protein